jgi:hypothetical protein
MDDYRESIWGIRPEDRKWFQLFTMVGGTAGSVILAILELESSSGVDSPSETARNLVLGIGASFVASGFVVWGVLQARELMSAIADWIRKDTERRREKWRRQMIEEGYKLGYKDAQEGKPPRPPGTSENGNQPRTGGEENGHREDQ